MPALLRRPVVRPNSGCVAVHDAAPSIGRRMKGRAVYRHLPWQRERGQADSVDAELAVAGGGRGGCSRAPSERAIWDFELAVGACAGAKCELPDRVAVDEVLGMSPVGLYCVAAVPAGPHGSSIASRMVP